MKSTITLILLTIVILINILSTSLILNGYELAGGIVNGVLLGGLFAWANDKRSKKD